MTVLKMTAVAILLGALMLALFLWAFQTYGVYHFSHSDSGPDSLETPGIERIALQAEDGSTIYVWVAQPEKTNPVIISFHGNFAEIAPSFKRLLPWVEKGHGLIMLEYRGSSNAPGRLNEKRLKSDAQTVYDHLSQLIPGRADEESNRHPIFIHGYSLGSSPATWLAAHRPTDGLIFEAGYTRLIDYWERRYRGLPIFRLMWSERHENIEVIGNVTAPILILHGAKDAALPVAWPKAVLDAAKAPKRFILYPQGSHADLHHHGMLEDVHAFITDPIRFVATH